MIALREDCFTFELQKAPKFVVNLKINDLQVSKKGF